jgi:hypothetical protein
VDPTSLTAEDSNAIVGSVAALATTDSNGSMKPNPDEEIARKRAPALTTILNELDRPNPSVAVMKSLRVAAREEYLLLTGDRMGAAEACTVLEVAGPNLYDTLRNATAQQLFGDEGVPIAQQTVGGGMMYYARHIRELAEALGPRPVGGRRKRTVRKKHPVSERATT